MDAQTADSLDIEPDPLLDAPVAPAAALLRAQAIDCGNTSVAVPFGWARAVIEDFAITPAPNAPIWLVGAFNAEGHILPVIDLAAWLDEHAAQPVDRDSKLLLGGEGEDRFALLFRGRPVMVRYADEAARAADAPERTLASYTVGQATMSGLPERTWPVIDARGLGADCFTELAV